MPHGDRTGHDAVHVDVLGPIRVRHGDRTVRPRSRAQRCVLALLTARAGGVVPRDTLVEAVWGTRPPRDPRHALQAHVSRLRQLLPTDRPVVTATTDGYRLAVDRVVVDAQRFQDTARSGAAALAEGRPAAAADALATALGLWRGSAFGDVADLPHVATEATRLETLRLVALEDRVEADLARGERPAALVAELRALLEDHPLRERLWQALMLAQDRNGQRADALATFRTARQVLAEEAGLDPGPDLVATHEALLRPAPPAPPTPATSPRGSARLHHLATAGPRLAGRAQEHHQLLDAWARGRDGLQVALIAGEAGIGKTRLAAQVAVEAETRGGLARYGRCDQDPVVPLHPFTEMLREHLADAPDQRPDADHPLARLLPEHLPTSTDPHGDQPVEQRRLLDAITAWLAEVSRTTPLVLVVDDLHAADPSTLRVLRHLVRAPDPVRGLLVATYRDTDPAPHLPPLLADLRRERHRVVDLRLEGLAPQEVADVLAVRLGASQTPALATAIGDRLHQVTGGNPFLALELAVHLDRRAVSPDRPEELRDALEEVPPSVRELVAQDVAALPPPTARLLECAALVGEEFDVRIARAAAGLTPAEADTAVGQLTRHGLLLDGGGTTRRFTHGLVRAAVRDEVPPLRRLELHERIGRSLEQVLGPDLRGHHERLAHHFAAADTDRDRTATYATLAGHDALHRHAADHAVAHYSRAMQAVGPGGPLTRRLDLLTWRGVARLQAGDPAYRDDLLLAGRAAAEAGDVDRLVHAATQNTRGWGSRTAAVDPERVALLETALGRLHDEADRHQRARVLSALAVEEVADPSRRGTALARSADAVALARAEQDPRLLAEVLEDHYAASYAAFHDPRGCVDVSAELVRLADELGDPALRMVADRCHAQATLLVGDLAASDRHLERAVRDAAAVDHPPRVWLTRSWWAMRLAVRGELDRAEDEALAAFQLGADSGQPDAMTWFGGQLFVLRDAQGRLAELVDLLAERLAEDAEAMPTWRAGQALGLLETGNPRGAEAILDALVQPDGIALPTDLLWLVGTAYLARVAVGTGRRDAAEVLHDALAPHQGLVATNAVVDAGPVDTQLGALAALLGRRREATEAFERAAQLTGDRAPLWRDGLDRARRTTAAA